MGAWWRLPLFATAGKYQRNPTTGKYKRKSSTGKLLRNTASSTTCCCTPVNPDQCQFCADSTPYSFTVDVSGITVCSCGLTLEITGNPNGIYTLASNGACQWAFVGDVNDFNVKQYNAGCSGATCYDGPPDSITWALTKFSGFWFFEIFAVKSSFPGGCAIPAMTFVFFRKTLSTINCADDFMLTNTPALADCTNATGGSGRWWGYGGSASFTHI